MKRRALRGIWQWRRVWAWGVMLALLIPMLGVYPPAAFADEPVRYTSASSFGNNEGGEHLAWLSDGETQGAWLAWTCGEAIKDVAPTIGLGLRSGDRSHGRPREVLIRLIRAVDESSLPELPQGPEPFTTPWPETMITAHRLTLSDEDAWQYLILDGPEKVLGFQIIVESVYPGEMYDDVAISDVRFPLTEADLNDGQTVAQSPAIWEADELGNAADESAGPPALALGGLAAVSGVLLISSYLVGGRRRR
ncbi:MAG: hypothetical protein ACOX9A_13950 [Anaerolineae bacterium]|jgi:hypothetical protein